MPKKIKAKRGRPKKIPINISAPEVPKEVPKSGDELELERLIFLRNEMDGRGVHDLSTLGVFIERLQNKIKSQKA